MPVLIGCAAVAEERKMGMLESQLCLPATRRSQFVLKLTVVMALAVIMGTVMPLLLEGTRILPKDNLFNDSSYYLNQYKILVAGFWAQIVLKILGTILSSLPVLTMVMISFSFAAISFYVSTLARNTLQGLAPAALGIISTFFLLVLAYSPGNLFHYPLWEGALIYLIAVPLMAIVLLTLAYWNYQCILPDWKAWRINFLALALSLALTAFLTSAIYYRSWELLTPYPPHGVAQLTPRQAHLHVSYGNITVVLPDGRVWQNNYTFDRPSLSKPASYKIQLAEKGKFLDGTNWLHTANCAIEIVGIQRDGSLWVSEKPRPWMQEGKKMASFESAKMIRIGSDNDWKGVSGGFESCCLLKNNGTIWL